MADLRTRSMSSSGCLGDRFSLYSDFRHVDKPSVRPHRAKLVAIVTTSSTTGALASIALFPAANERKQIHNKIAF